MSFKCVPTFTLASCKLVAAVGVMLALCSMSAQSKDLYVATSGSDGVSYASNSLSAPWKTIEHGLYNLKAGDRLLVRGGTYTARYPVWLNSDYNRQTKGGDPNETLNAESGTASARVIIDSYNGEKVTIDLASVPTWVNLDNKSYWTFRNLTFVNVLMVFVLGEDNSAMNNSFENLNITANRGGDNAAPIHLWSSRADYTTIKNCRIKGPGQSVHLNTSTIYAKGVNHLKILNNVLSDAPIGIYFKHRNDATSASQVDVEVAYNYITNTTRASLEYNGNYTRIHDNIFGVNTAAAHFGDANGGAGADYNTIEHNTFLSGSIVFDSAVESGDPYPGVVGNTVINNIFQKALEVLRYSSMSNTNTLGKNVYPSGTAILSANNLLKVVANAILGTPTYSGGPAPTSIGGFLLASGSVGKGAATAGADMGADVAKVQGTAQPEKVSAPPTQLTVQ